MHKSDQARIATSARLRSVIVAMLALSAAGFGACDDGGPPSSPTDTGRTGAFTSGIASADVTSTSAIVWTRAEGADAPLLEIATDDAFTRDIRTERLTGSADADWTVQRSVDGLEPATRYRYRFRAGDAVSATGTFTTAPAGDNGRAVRFVFSGDSDGSRRPDGTPPYNEFEALDAARAEDPAFFLYFGDTIYADRAPIASTLDGYRGKYRENRGYRALTDILAAAPIFTMWDDHEVVNDFAGTTVDAAMLEAGRRAFREYMPIADTGDAAQLYRAFRYGRDIELIMVDARSYRDASAVAACTADGAVDPLPAGGLPGAPPSLRAVRALTGLPSEVPPACAAALADPDRALLGMAQLAWLRERLSASEATWKIVVTPVPIQSLLVLPYDRWEGYSAERESLLAHIRDDGIGNVVFLSTDFHANIFGPVRDAAGTAVAYEAIVGPIATAPLAAEVREAVGDAAAAVLPGFLASAAGTDCAVLDAFAYGVAETSADGRTLLIAAKDAQGTVLCAKMLEASE